VKLGIIGLGRMGYAIACRVLQSKLNKYDVLGFDTSEESQKKAEAIGVDIVADIKDLAERADIIWLMLPAGNLIDKVINEILPHLTGGDIIVDGGNSNFKDSITRAENLKKHEIYFLDCGTSGGMRGKDLGFSLMVGGDEKAYNKITPLLERIAAKNGFAHMGPSGAGHYVKMVHNGIEYALLQSYAEGFYLLKSGHYKHLDLEKISRVWCNGSVIRSFILELVHEIYAEKIDFEKVIGEIQEGGTGQWMVEEAKKHDILVKLIQESLDIRKDSRQTGGNYATKLVALLRNKFGGHEYKKRD